MSFALKGVRGEAAALRKRNGGAETELCHEDEAVLSEGSEGTAGATVTGMLSIFFLFTQELYPKIHLIWSYI